MIDVEFINGSKRFTVKALLDSGADSCAISSDMATALGLDTGGERGVSFGVTGSVESVIRTLNIRLSVAHESYNLKVPVRILFVDERDSGSCASSRKIGIVRHIQYNFRSEEIEDNTETRERVITANLSP